jgi:hypothetical protein
LLTTCIIYNIEVIEVIVSKTFQKSAAFEQQRGDDQKALISNLLENDINLKNDEYK